MNCFPLFINPCPSFHLRPSPFSSPSSSVVSRKYKSNAINTSPMTSNRHRCNVISNLQQPQSTTTTSATTDSNSDSKPQALYFATCARGLGSILAEELTTHPEINADIVNIISSGVYFHVKCIYSTILWIRSATRILHHLNTFELHSTNQLYDSARSLFDWPLLLNDGQLTFSIQVRCDTSYYSNIGLTIKNAICDSLRDAGFPKPDPPPNYSLAHVPLFVAVSNDHHISIYRDMVGASLHKRGYRFESSIHKSNLNEALAAAILYFSGFTSTGTYKRNNDSDNNTDNDKNEQLVIIDPMCGSATLLIEATLLKLQVPIGLYRPNDYPFETWPDFQPSIFKTACDNARKRQKLTASSVSPHNFSCVGVDINPAAVSLARRDVEYTKLQQWIRIYHSDIHDFNNVTHTKGKDILVLSNPPWGRRLKDEQDAWYDLGQFLRRYAGDNGMKAVLLSGDTHVTRPLRMKAKVKHPVRIGNVDARVLEYDVLPKRKDLHDSLPNAQSNSDYINKSENSPL